MKSKMIVLCLLTLATSAAFAENNDNLLVETPVGRFARWGLERSLEKAYKRDVSDINISEPSTWELGSQLENIIDSDNPTYVLTFTASSVDSFECPVQISSEKQRIIIDTCVSGTSSATLEPIELTYYEAHYDGRVRGVFLDPNL